MKRTLIDRPTRTAPPRKANSHRPPRSAVVLASGVIGLVAVGTPRVEAEGFRNPPVGAYALGRAGGRLAHIDDSSAVAHNPANLVDLEDAEFEVAPTIADLQWKYRSSAVPGQKAATEDTWKLLPDFFASMPLRDNQLALGLGITTPYGIGSEWDDSSSAFRAPTSVLRYQTAYSAERMTVKFNPTLALRLGKHVQIGAGLDVMWSQLTLKQHYPWFLATESMVPDGTAEAQGDGIGFGGNLGVTFSFAERHRIALTCRSPISVQYNGDFELDNVPAPLGGGTLKSDFESDIHFPTIVGVGYGLQLSKTVRVGVDAEWIEFSNFDELPLKVPSVPPTLGLPTSVPERWRDTFTIGIGGDWRFARNWIFRLSYQYYQSPKPDSTLSPTLVDADQNVVTFGLGYRYRRHHFDITYSPVFYDSRHVDNSYNPAFNGDYGVTLNLYSFAYRFTF